jgi:uncharacterized phage protein gp47/JayE
MSGLSTTGFVPESLSDVQTAVQNTLVSQLGPEFNLVAPSLAATIVGIVAERLSLLWSAAEDVYNSQYPDTASGTSLDNVVALTGITRLAATQTKYSSLLLFGTAGTTVPQGTLVSVQNNPTAIFSTDTAATLGAGTNCVQTITFGSAPVAGQFTLEFGNQFLPPLSFAASAQNLQDAMNGLLGVTGVTVTGSTATAFVVTFAGASGKQPQSLLSVSANSLTNSSASPVTITPVMTTTGVAQASVSITATSTGATPAPARSITVINTPVSGLNSIINQTDAVIGRAIETDAELRIRRANSLQVAGSGTPDAIRSKLLSESGVTDVFVFENITLLPDLAGRPPKSYEVVVNGGVDQTITQTVWDTKPAGIETVGSITGTATDTAGNSQTVKWSRPTVIPIYLELDITTDYTYPTDGDAQVVAAILAFGATLKISQSIIVSPQLICALDAITGITGITVKIGTAPSPTLPNNIIIQTAQIAQFDSSRIVVVST